MMDAVAPVRATGTPPAGAGLHPAGVGAVRAEAPARPGARLMVSAGVPSPVEDVTGVEVEGARIEAVLAEDRGGAPALLLRAEAATVAVIWRLGPPLTGAYPEAAFAPRANAWDRASPGLAALARDIADRAGGGEAAVAALAHAAQARFAYGHPAVRFDEGLDAVPALGGAKVEGSCVDIHGWFVAALRAAGIEAAYIHGHFFPAERGGFTCDMHCWTAVRVDGVTREWDVAHHVKHGLGPAAPGRDPRPGVRVALGHGKGQGWRLPDGRRVATKLLSEPMTLDAEGRLVRIEGLRIWRLA